MPNETPSNEKWSEELIPPAEVEEFLEEPSAEAGEYALRSEAANGTVPDLPASQPVSQPNGQSVSEPENTADSDNFLPTETFTWYYSLRDLSDEIFWAVVFVAVWIGLFLPPPQTGNWQVFHNCLTVLFGVGILYFSFLYHPLKPFLKKKKEEAYRSRSLRDVLKVLVLVLALCVLIFRIADGFGICARPSEPVAEVAEAENVPDASEVPAVSKDETTVKAESSQKTLVVETQAEPEPVVTPEPVAEPEPAAEPDAPSVSTSATVKETETNGKKPETSETHKATTGEKLKELGQKAEVSLVETLRWTLITLYGICVWCYVISLLIHVFFNRVCTYYRLSPIHFTSKTGFFITEERKIAIWDVAQVNVSRNLWQRLLGVGTIELRIRDHGLTGENDENPDLPDNVLTLNGLRNPEEVKDLLNTYRLFIRRRMGRRILNKIAPAKGEN